MNEIEETLLCIFLASWCAFGLDEGCFNGSLEFGSFFNNQWEKFKQEELGRTLPEEFEFYISNRSLQKIENKFDNQGAEPIWIDQNKNDVQNIKIKITVVEND